jgi:phosphatidylserine/phosphatidylglycerophosphate/cardiolipin synthase-like enzyme
MAFRTDAGGFAFKCSDCKLQTGASTWATKLSQLHRQTGTVRIVTYSLPAMDYVRTQLGRRPRDIFLIAHEKFTDRAVEIRREFPHIRVAVHPKVHSKVLLVAPRTIIISSANFGSSGWHETSLSLHSAEAHDDYVGVFARLWNASREIVEGLTVAPPKPPGGKGRERRTVTTARPTSPTLRCRSQNGQSGL